MVYALQIEVCGRRAVLFFSLFSAEPRWEDCTGRGRRWMDVWLRISWNHKRIWTQPEHVSVESAFQLRTRSGEEWAGGWGGVGPLSDGGDEGNLMRPRVFPDWARARTGGGIAPSHPSFHAKPATLSGRWGGVYNTRGWDKPATGIPEKATVDRLE